MRRSLSRALILACGVAAFLGGWGASHPLAAQEREEILSFDVTVEIRDGNHMVVTEAITVRALGDEIKRGIYRDFPTSFPRSSGFGRIEAPFNVLSVERDGRGEPWAVESIGGPEGRGGVRVRIGNANVLVSEGVHEYTLRYETWRWVRFGEAEDQLYWNVTGNGWGFPIERASARIFLPGQVEPARVRLEAWTGAEGSTAGAATSAWDAASGAAAFETTAPLAPREGLTVRITFPKGVVAPPSPDVEAMWFQMDWGGWIAAAKVAGMVLALYLVMWIYVGQDPQRGAVVVQYEPPPGFSPAALGYLKARGYDQALLSATLVSLAVKGALTIEKEGRKWTLRRGGSLREPLSTEEQGVLNELLGSRRELALTATHAKTLQKGIKKLKGSLAGDLEKRYFVLNRTWFAVGLGASAVGFAVLVWRGQYGIAPEAWFFALWLSFWSIGVGTLVIRAGKAWSAAVRGAGFGSWVEAIFLSVFATPFVAAEIFVFYLLTVRVPQHLLAAAAALGFLNVLFYHLLERPTMKGRGVLNHLDGFLRFLTATDADRLDRMTAPARTPELFERFLPHAIALGVENRWAEGFQGVLAAGATSPGSSSTLGWYHGGTAASLGGVASSLGGAFSGSLSSASSPPSSGGGGGGGGSSGGGGGGGGGGGW